MLNEGNFVLVISGPSGSGKSSTVKRFLEKEKKFDASVSHTTRAMRAGESEGKEYYFVSKDVFMKMVKNNEFLEWAEVFGNCYGTSRREIERILDRGRNVILEIDVEGAKVVKDIFGEKAVLVFVLPENINELKRRLVDRKTDSENDILTRINEAKREIASIDVYDYVIINEKDAIDATVNRLASVCLSERSRTERFWDNYKKTFWRE